MKRFSRGFAWVPLLVAVIVIIVGAGSYLVWKQVQTSVLVPTAVSTAEPAATIDQTSLNTTSITPTITGTAKNISSVNINILYSKDGSTLQHKGVCGTTVPVINGRWSLVPSAPDNCIASLYPGTFYISIVTDAGASLADGVLTIGNAAAISVSNMSQYTDKDFGFSFWYPSGWSVIQENPMKSPWVQIRDATLTRILDVGKPGEVGIRIEEAHSPAMSITDTGGAGPFGAVKYFFDPVAHSWMTTAPEGTPTGGSGATTTITSFVNTIGGLHMLGGTSRFDTNIIPLRATDFVIVSDGGEVGAQFLAKTVSATDPSVATPMSEAEQTKAIQAEKDAYAAQ